jgi:hypothetical protein
MFQIGINERFRIPSVVDSSSTTDFCMEIAALFV